MSERYGNTTSISSAPRASASAVSRAAASGSAAPCGKFATVATGSTSPCRASAACAAPTKRGYTHSAAGVPTGVSADAASAAMLSSVSSSFSDVRSIRCSAFSAASVN